MQSEHLIEKIAETNDEELDKMWHEIRVLRAKMHILCTEYFSVADELRGLREVLSTEVYRHRSHGN